MTFRARGARQRTHQFAADLALAPMTNIRSLISFLPILLVLQQAELAAGLLECAQYLSTVRVSPPTAGRAPTPAIAHRIEEAGGQHASSYRRRRISAPPGVEQHHRHHRMVRLDVKPIALDSCGSAPCCVQAVAQLGRCRQACNTDSEAPAMDGASVLENR